MKIESIKFKAKRLDNGEWIFNCKPDMWAGDCIEHNYWLPQDRHGAYGFQLPQGSIKKLIGKELSFSDEPVELK